MVRKGYRKSLVDDPEAQQTLLDKIESEEQAERERRRLRRCVRYYDLKAQVWSEVTLRFGQRCEWETFWDLPDRRFSDWGLRSESGEFFGAEVGATCDGLPHAVWVRGPYDHPECTLFQNLVSRLGQLPAVFFDLYKVRVSVPQLLIGLRDYQERHLLAGSE